MYTSDTLSSLLVAHGVTTLFASPGSRNAPLLTAFSHNPALRVEMVVDERSAAFMAVGYASIRREPVAIVCTSGTAMLNYMPAVAEAAYRQLPIVVITADRPEPWIDQDDSQTIRQPHAMDRFVKASCDLADPAHPDADDQWHANREINNALLSAVAAPAGPVHINVRVSAATLAAGADIAPRAVGSCRVVKMLQPRPQLSTTEARALGASIASPCRVMIVLGFMPPSAKITKAMSRLAALPNVAVLAENLANIHSHDAHGCIDTMLSMLSAEEEGDYVPDLVISAGGSLVSRHLKEFLRRHRCRHWHVGLTGNTIDCFRQLEMRIAMEPDLFFAQLASAMHPHRRPSHFAAMWRALSQTAVVKVRRMSAEAPWSALAAFGAIIPAIPPRWNVESSNGTSIRYLQLFPCEGLHRVSCNRGVSGIDGSTSTAVGAMLAAPHDVTLLITGDMSLQYDLSALGTQQVTTKLKVIVMDNGGGGIFRFVGATRHLPELEECFVVPRRFPLTQLATAWGWRVWESSTMGELQQCLIPFIHCTADPAMLIVHTDGARDAEILTELLTKPSN